VKYHDLITASMEGPSSTRKLPIILHSLRPVLEKPGWKKWNPPGKRDRFSVGFNPKNAVAPKWDSRRNPASAAEPPREFISPEQTPEP
jgi:hypothetical protein